MNAVQLRIVDIDTPINPQGEGGCQLRVLPSMRSDRTWTRLLEVPALAAKDAQTPVDKDSREGASYEIEPAAVLGLRQALNSEVSTYSARQGRNEILSQACLTCQATTLPATPIFRPEAKRTFNQIHALSRPDNVVRGGLHWLLQACKQARDRLVPLVPALRLKAEAGLIPRERGRDMGQVLWSDCH